MITAEQRSEILRFLAKKRTDTAFEFAIFGAGTPGAAGINATLLEDAIRNNTVDDQYLLRIWRGLPNARLTSPVPTWSFAVNAPPARIPRTVRAPLRTKVTRAPGAHLLTFAAIIFGQRKCERVFAQIVADMRNEYFDALNEGRRARAFFARLRGYWEFAKAAGLTGVFKLGALGGVVKYGIALLRRLG
jgi:hypothetical protein